LISPVSRLIVKMSVSFAGSIAALAAVGIDVSDAKSKPVGQFLGRLRLPGVYLQALEQRSYLPGGAGDLSLASSMLGFVDYQGNGQRGVEAYYNRQLSGRDGFLSTYRDLAGRELMLSGETANGLYPIESVEMMARNSTVPARVSQMRSR